MTQSFPAGFQWDEDKNRANVQKHGIDFRDAVRVFEGPTLDRVDRRADYGEPRTNSLGELAGTIVVNVTHTERNGDLRIISGRLAKLAERELYQEFKRNWGRSVDRGQTRHRDATVIALLAIIPEDAIARLWEASNGHRRHTL